jgi:Delta3-Delta2-enoyl-CoA isomerase
MCSAYTFPRVFGKSKAGELLYVGEKMNGIEAHQYKLVSKVFKTKEDMMKVARENAEKIAQLDYESMLACKSLVKSTNQEEIQKIMRKEIDNLIIRWNADSLFQVIANFMQRPKSKL